MEVIGIKFIIDFVVYPWEQCRHPFHPCSGTRTSKTMHYISRNPSVIYNYHQNFPVSDIITMLFFRVSLIIPCLGDVVAKLGFKKE